MIMDIEKLAQEAYKEEQQVPENLWSEISAKMESPKKPNLAVWTGVGMLAIGAVFGSLVMLNNPDAEPEIEECVVAETQPMTAEPVDMAVTSKDADFVELRKQEVVKKEYVGPSSDNESQLQSLPEREIRPRAEKEPVGMALVEKGLVDNTCQEKMSKGVIKTSSESVAINTSTKPALTSETVAQKAPNPVEPTVAPIKVEPPAYIPNLITVNGDGYNDKWVLPSMETYDRVAVSIYTAKGRCVYTHAHYDNSFDGASLEAGNYFYVITFYRAEQLPTTRRGVLVIKHA